MWHSWERKEKVYSFFMGKHEGKRQLGRTRRKWEDGTRIGIGEIGWGDVK
jgi:hypothetical protein